MPLDDDGEPLDAALVAADAELKRREDEARDFAKRLNIVGRTFDEAYEDVRRVSEQLRSGRLDWHFILKTLNSKVKEADSEPRLYEPDKKAGVLELALRSTFVRMVTLAHHSHRMHEALQIIKGRSKADEHQFRQLAQEARHLLFYDLLEAVTKRAAKAFPETQAEARVKYEAARSANMLQISETEVCTYLLRALDRTFVTKAEIEEELDRLARPKWTLLVLALMAAHPKALKTKELKEKTSVDDPGGKLRCIRDESPVLRRVIVLPGAKGRGGYRLQNFAH